MRFRRTRRGIEAAPDEVETAVLRRCAADLLELLGGEPEPSGDPLEALLGMPAGDTGRPGDPALVRLLPDAYGDDDPDASSEFRRYTEGDLRAGKRAGCTTVLTTLPAVGGTLRLDREQAMAWLGCLNDLRLVLGTRLGLQDDPDPDDLDPDELEPDELEPDELEPDDPRRQSLQVYGWLGWLQESLLGCLTPRG